MLSAPLAFDQKLHGATAEENRNGSDQSPGEVKMSLRDLCKGDLYYIGLLWIAALKTVLLGPIPTIEAAASDQSDEKPKKPPKMRYKDLPLYETPYYEYKDFVAKKHDCPEQNRKMLHQYLLPTVSSWRSNVEKKAKDTCKQVRSITNDLTNDIENKAEDFMFCMRCEGNYKVRYGILALGTLLGFRLGRGGGGYTKRLFFTGLGALAGGALCFPNETDAVFKNCAYHIGSTVVSIYNTFCGKNAVLPTKVPCHQDHPHQE